MNHRMENRQLEHSPLTDPKILLADNKSREAQSHITGYTKAKKAKGLTEVFRCSDARAAISPFVPRDDIIDSPSIAAATDKSALLHTIIHVGTKQVIVLQHYDGSTVSKDKYPKGCGGLGVKDERVINKEQPATKGIMKFVDHRIHHPGIYNASYREALAVAQITGKPILAGALDHLTGLIHPFVLLTNEGKTAHASVPFGRFNDPSSIYRNGIPDLSEDQIPASFHDILSANRRQVASLYRNSPHLPESQKIQNPVAIVLTTSLIPIGHRYPKTFGDPNTGFVVSMPIVKENGVITGVNDHAFETDVLAQLEYPIENATTAQTGHGGHGFGSTHRIIIETPDIELSRGLAHNIAEQPWIQKWLSIKQNKLWIAEVATGQTRVIETLT